MTIYLQTFRKTKKEVIEMMEKNNEKKVLGDGIYNPGARPMEVFRDEDGCLWLCDKGTDPDKDFEQQGCWRCKDLAFTRND